MYKYKYQASKNSIVSVKGNNITAVYISDEQGNRLASFEGLKCKKNTVFSLTACNPLRFSCTSGCPFRLDSNKIYQFDILPKGDRMLPPILLKVAADGSKSVLKKIPMKYVPYDKH
jgi:hypothetical protein